MWECGNSSPSEIEERRLKCLFLLPRPFSFVRGSSGDSHERNLQRNEKLLTSVLYPKYATADGTATIHAKLIQNVRGVQRKYFHRLAVIS